MTEEQHEAVTGAVRSVDDAIAKIRAQGEEARQKLAKVTEAAEKSKAAASTKDTELADAQAALKALPEKIQARQADATKAAAAAALAREAKQPARAILLLDQLADALDWLDERADPEYEAGLRGQIAAAWDEHVTASNERATAVDEVAKAQAALDDATKRLDAALKSRDDDVKSKLVALETAWAAKQPAEPAASEKAGWDVRRRIRRVARLTDIRPATARRGRLRRAARSNAPGWHRIPSGERRDMFGTA